MNNAKSIRRALMNARPRKADGGEVDDGFKEALREGFGDRPLGLSAETRQQMETPTPLGAINKGIINPAIAAGDAVLRGANAGVYGLAHGARKVYEALQPSMPQNWNESLGTGQQLERDIRDIPNAFMGDLHVPTNAAQTAVNIAKKPATNAERGMINLGRDGEAAASAAVAAAAPEPTYFSALERGIAGAKQAKASPQEWKAIVSKLPKEEVEWRGLDKFLDGQKGSVTRDQLLAHLNDNPVQVHDVWKGKKPFSEDEMHEYDQLREQERRDPGNLTAAQWRRVEELEDAKAGASGDKTKYHEYQLPGGENYRELLLTVPTRMNRGNLAQLEKEGSTARQAAIAKHDELVEASDRLGRNHPDVSALLSQYRDLSNRASGIESEFERIKRDGIAQDFKSQHFEEPNILAHVRMNDRTGPDGQKLLHVEEIQSDWHQKGKAHGYDTPDKLNAAAQERIERYTAQRDAMKQLQETALANQHYDEARTYENQARNLDARIYDLQNNGVKKGDGVPDAPFKDTKDWTGLAMKRVMRYAADNGYDGVTWTTGAQQADRYDLSKQIDDVSYSKNADGTYQLYATPKGGEGEINLGTKRHDEIADVVGKDLAEKIAAGEGRSNESGPFKTLSGVDLKVGGEGMKTYYDNIVPSVANKLAKQYGSKVGKTTFGVHMDGNEKVRPGDRVTPVSGGYVVRRAGGENYGFWDDKDAAQQWLDKALRASEHATEVHHLPITPAMKGKAHKMFKRGGRVEADPSEAQKQAGNYRKEHVRFQGLDISIENKKGSQRRGTDASGKAWACTLPADYGYIKGTEGADGDHVDVYLGPDKSSPLVFVINQHDHKTGKFDEHKVCLGYTSERAAVADYCKAFSDGKGPDRLKSIEPMSMDAFKQWLKSGKTKKPAISRVIVDRALKLVSTLGPHRSAKHHV